MNTLGGSTEVAEAIRARRALRSLDPRPLETGVEAALAEAVTLSASCFNNQPWRMVFCSGRRALNEVRSALPKGNVWATRAPLVVAVASRTEDDCRLSEGRDYDRFDCGLAVGQMLLRATELGIVAHPIAGYDPLKVKAALGIPDGYTVIALVICGYHSTDDSLLSEKQREAEGTRPTRRPVGETLFRDRWGDPLD